MSVRFPLLSVVNGPDTPAVEPQSTSTFTPSKNAYTVVFGLSPLALNVTPCGSINGTMLTSTTLSSTSLMI